jgi:hypothetical protein
MFLSAVSVLVVVQLSSEVPEGLMNNPVFVSARDEVIGKWRRQPDEELHDLHSNTNIIGVIKSRRLK